MRLIAALKRRTTQKQNKMQEPGRTVPWNPTLAQKTRKDGAPTASYSAASKAEGLAALQSMDEEFL